MGRFRNSLGIGLRMRALWISVACCLGAPSAWADEAPGGGLARLGVMVPLKDAYAGAQLGVTADLGYWYEAPHFAIEPRVGFATSADTTGDRRFYEVPADIGFFYVFPIGNVALYAGGGAGVRYLYEFRREVITVGQVIRTQHVAEREDKGFGFSAYGRAGVMLLRNSGLSLMTSLGYSITLKTINERSNPQALSAGVGLVF